MGQKITISIPSGAPYTRYVTGQNGLADIDEKDDVLAIVFTMPDLAEGQACRVSYGESASTPWSRWPVVNVGSVVHNDINQGLQSGFILFRVGGPNQGNQVNAAPGTPISINISMHDPAKHPTGPYDAPKTMFVDWQPLV